MKCLELLLQMITQQYIQLRGRNPLGKAGLGKNTKCIKNFFMYYTYEDDLNVMSKILIGYGIRNSKAPQSS